MSLLLFLLEAVIINTSPVALTVITPFETPHQNPAGASAPYLAGPGSLRLFLSAPCASDHRGGGETHPAHPRAGS